MRAARPTVETKFHIDFAWWERQNRSPRIHMLEYLCAECRESLGAQTQAVMIDMVDPETAEVTRVDSVWEAIRACCSTKPGYVSEDTPVLDSIFRLFLANGNKPLSAQELYEQLDKRPPETILRVLTKGSVHLGIRPV